MNKDQLIKVAMDDDKLLDELVPGKSDFTIKAKSQIKSFVRNSSAKGVLLLGPIGSGKSTIARIMALMRYLHYCKDEKCKQTVENLKFDGPFRIDKKFLNFYEEMNITGLVPNLVQTQLFGVAKGAATEVTEKAGIFEQAMTGHSTMDKKTIGAEITGGVVFLDEICDLEFEHQPLLLSTLTGTEVFRVGGEGDPNYGYSFNGSVIAATWKDPFNGSLRPDLLSRLANYVIELPGLNDRKDEFEDIVNDIKENIYEEHRNHINRLEIIDPEYVSRAKLKKERKRNIKMDSKSVKLLKSQNWDELGNLRGLRQILEKCFHDQVSASEALKNSVLLNTKRSHPIEDLSSVFIQEMIESKEPTDVSKVIKSMEKQNRALIAKRIQKNPIILSQVSKKLGISEKDLKKQLTDLSRDRSRRKNGTE